MTRSHWCPRSFALLTECARRWRGADHPGRAPRAHQAPPVWHSVWLLFLYGALDGHPLFPSHVASGRCFLWAVAAGALAGVISAFAEPSSWCVGTVLNVAWCAVCVSAAPNNWPRAHQAPPPAHVSHVRGFLGAVFNKGRDTWIARQCEHRDCVGKLSCGPTHYPPPIVMGTYSVSRGGRRLRWLLPFPHVVHRGTSSASVAHSLGHTTLKGRECLGGDCKGGQG